MSQNLITLMTIAAELRSGGMSWENVATHVHRKPATCAKWPSRYRAHWDRLYREAHDKREEDARNEGLTFLRNWMRGKDPRWSLKAIEILFKSGPKRVESAQPNNQSSMDADIDGWKDVYRSERERMDGVRKRQGLPPLTDDEFWDQLHVEMQEVMASGCLPEEGEKGRGGEREENTTTAESEEFTSLSPASEERAGVRGSSWDSASGATGNVMGSSGSATGQSAETPPSNELNLLRIFLLMIATLAVSMYVGRNLDSNPTVRHDAAPSASIDRSYFALHSNAPTQASMLPVVIERSGPYAFPHGGADSASGIDRYPHANERAMHAPDRREFLNLSAALLGAGLWPTTGLAADAPAKGLVTGQPQGAAAGKEVLAAGGNAVDAIVSAALVAGVVAVQSTGIAGYGGHLVVARPDGKVSAIDFNSTAPAALKPDAFAADAQGKVKDNINMYGWLAAGVPGVLAGLQLALDTFGSKPFAELVKPAIRFAKEGFPISKGSAAAIQSAKARLGRDAGSAKLFFVKNEPLTEGAICRNPDLGDLLQKLASRGSVATFYKGDIADAIAAGFKKNGGLVTADDLAAYRAVEVKPLALDFFGHTILTPPPSAGGLTVLQTLATLKALEWNKWDAKDPATVHARVEALRIAWQDRLKWLGDPKHADVPIERLLSEKYAKETAERIQAAVKAKKPIAGRSDGMRTDGTIHLTAVDANGMMAALTFTHGGSFGAQVTIDGLGLILGHGMSRFDPRAGRANSPAPGKRPLHNMCPTIVVKDGKPVLALGATGGRRIVNTVFDVLAYRFGQSLTLADAVKAPRMHTEGDATLTMEATWPGLVTDHLKGIGYAVKPGPGATLNAIERVPTSGDLRTAAR